MALNKNYTKNIYGKDIIFENAYIQIIHDDGDKNIRNIQVVIYDTNEKINIVEQTNYSFVPDITDGSVNFIKQGYEYLKTLDKYIDAVDC